MNKLKTHRPTDQEAEEFRDACSRVRVYLATFKESDGTRRAPHDRDLDAFDLLLHWATEFDPRQAHDDAIRDLERLHRIDACLDRVGLTFDERGGVFEQKPGEDVRSIDEQPFDHFGRRR